MNPLQQGLKLPRRGPNVNPKLCCNNESTTTRIETHDTRWKLLIRVRCNNESTTTRIETSYLSIMDISRSIVAIMNPLQQGLKLRPSTSCRESHIGLQ